ncbi:hypothetical protein IAT40_006018 [Kwoniella sp. CBS 6097]
MPGSFDLAHANGNGISNGNGNSNSNGNSNNNFIASQNSALLEAHHEECNAKHELENGAGSCASSTMINFPQKPNGALPRKVSADGKHTRVGGDGEIVTSPSAVGNPTQFLEGTHNFEMPAAVAGTAPPLTARPYLLSKGYSHLVEALDENRDVICEKVGKLESDLPQLGSDDLRQAKADIVYLRTILDGEGKDVAQVHAGATWAARDA